IGVLDNNPFQVDPCKTLQDLMDPTKQNILPEINWLKNKLINGEQIEWSSSFNKNTLQNERQSGTQYNVKINIGSNYVGSIHLHPKTGYGIFSWVDLQTLAKTRSNAALQKQANVTLMLVTHNPDNPSNPNVYALFIEDSDKLQSQLDNMWNASRFNINGVPASDEDKIKTIHDEMAIKYEKNKNNLEAYFLKYVASYGVSIYKANNDVSQWSKLERSNLNGTEIAFPNPCVQL
ncbi:MAG: hypothetical protein Q8K02_06205, partial [Flavobacterium sp.]|nr:hypothetical protein [Flavobacterium sp.]